MLEKGIISNKQLLFLLIAFKQSMALTVGYTFEYTKQSTWIVVLVTFIIAILDALMLLKIAKRYPEKNLVQINDKVFGVYAGKAVSALYLWFFFQLITHYMFFFNSFWITYIMPETPREAFLIMFCIACAFAVRKGLEVITRGGFLFSLTVWLTTTVLVTLLLSDMKLTNLLPLLHGTFKNFVHSTHMMSTIPFGDLIVFLMIFPYTAENQKLKKPVLIAICISFLQLFIVVVRDILVLGPRLVNSSSPSFAAARMIDVADVLTRMDVLVAIALLITIFIKVTVFFYVTALGTAQLLHLRSYKPLVIPLGVLIVLVSAKLYPSDMEQAYAALYAWPFNAMVFEYLFPLITLIVIEIQRLTGKLKGMAAQ